MKRRDNVLISSRSGGSAGDQLDDGQQDADQIMNLKNMKNEQADELVLLKINIQQQQELKKEKA